MCKVRKVVEPLWGVDIADFKTVSLTFCPLTLSPVIKPTSSSDTSSYSTSATSFDITSSTSSDATSASSSEVPSETSEDSKIGVSPSTDTNSGKSI